MKNKKSFLVVIMLLLIMPIFVNADYLTSEKLAENFITRMVSSNKNSYIINGNYSYENGVVVPTTSYFISKSEFEITSNGNPLNSYLFDGTKFWTSTSNGIGKHYIIGTSVTGENDGVNNVSTKATKMVNLNAIVSGNGSNSEPWTFIEEFTVTVKSENTATGTITPSKKTVLSGGTLEFTINPASGFDAVSTTCGSNATINKENRTIIISNILKDLDCSVEFGSKMYKITLNDTPNPNTIYLKYDSNWYKNQEGTVVFKKLDAVPVKTGYLFKGYYYNGTLVIDENGNIVANKTIFNKDVTLNATFEPIRYTYNYSCGVGSGSMISTTCIYDQSCLLSKSSCFRNGYDFNGWTDENNTSYINMDDVKNAVTQNNKVTTLTAQWTPMNYTVTFNGNGGTPDKKNMSVTYTNPYGSLASATRVGYTFAGWYTADIGGTLVTNNTKYTETGDTTLYAHWTAHDLQVIEDAPKDQNNILTNGVYIRYSNYIFVVYKVESDGYKAILNDAYGTSYYLQYRCCNNGKCYYSNDSLDSEYIKSSLTRFRTSLSNWSNYLVNNSWDDGYYDNSSNYATRFTSSYVGLLSYKEYLLAPNKTYIYSGFTGGYFWTMTPIYGDGYWSYMENRTLYYNGRSVTPSTQMINSSAYVRPVVKFKKGLVITGGTGTSSDPYQI